jgi:sterol desaturase/sphingolipid hydroxylase (fatty acid hydroxylase superfamily)
MSAAVLEAEPWIRLGGFAAAFALLAASELVFPARRLAHRAGRWRTNLGLTVVSTLLLRVSLPLAAIGVAIWAQQTGVGLFNALHAPLALSLPLSLLALDALIYGQHVAMHKVGALWRLHKVHHADPELDVTTALRFHPFEIFASMIVKMGAVALLGAPPVSVLLFEVLLNAMAMFNHANLQLGATADRLLRSVIVTPDMHRVHHSTALDAQNRNFGFNLSLWDRIFATYHGADRAELDATRIGLAEFAGGGPRLDLQPTRFVWSLILPFLKSDIDATARKEATR